MFIKHKIKKCDSFMYFFIKIDRSTKIYVKFYLADFH